MPPGATSALPCHSLKCQDMPGFPTEHQGDGLWPRGPTQGRHGGGGGSRTQETGAAPVSGRHNRAEQKGPAGTAGEREEVGLFENAPITVS